MTSSGADRGAVVILGGAHRSTWIVYNALKDTVPIQAVVIEGAESTWAFLKRRARRLGWLTVAGQVLFEVTVIPWLRWRSRRRLSEICATYSLDARAAPAELVHHVDSVNSESALELLKRFNPRVVVINATRILSRRLLGSVPAIFINTHAGITPQFRGVHGGYWALATGHADQFGVTVHLVDPGIDTGGILAQARMTPTKEDNFLTYPLLQLAAGLPLLRRAVADALENRLVTVAPPAGPSKLWSHPTLWEYLWVLLRRGVR
jgi:folate-dependent phosphoribosylglycinamide formyltransferase PurN